MPPVGFEPTISAGERQQTHALEWRGYWDRHAMEIRLVNMSRNVLFFNKQLRELTSSNYSYINSRQPPALCIKLRNSQHKPAANIMMTLEIRYGVNTLQLTNRNYERISDFTAIVLATNRVSMSLPCHTV